MKILLVITGMGVGGAERQLAALADGFVNQGHEVRLIALTGPLLISPTSPLVRIKMLKMKKDIFSFIRASYSIQKSIREFLPDVVHAHMIHANLLLRIARIFAPIPKLICSAHSSNEGGWSRMMCYRLTDFLASSSTNVSLAAVSAFEQKRAIPVGRMRVFYNGVDIEKFSFSAERRNLLRKQLRLDSDTTVLLAVGRLVEVKDYPTMLRALSVVSQQCPKVRLLIAGGGPLQQHLMQIVRELNLCKHVHFLGVFQNVKDLLCASDLFILSSRWEGFPMSVIEAMACKCPIVSTDCGGVDEALGNKKNLVSVGDWQGFARMVIRVLNENKEMKARDVDMAVERVKENFSLEKIVKQWLIFYGYNG